MRGVKYWYLVPRYNAVNERVFEQIYNKGSFHGWHNDNEKGLKAIVEKENGTIDLVDYDKITFINDKPTNTKENT